MIPILNSKGKPLGLDYDYEYRGCNREYNRDAPLRQIKITWGIFVFLFLFASVFVIVQYLMGKSNGTLGECLFVSGTLLGIAALCYYVIRANINRHNRLMEIIRNHKNTAHKPS